MTVIPLARLDRTLLDVYQHGFPLTPRPFLAIARKEGADEDTVLAAFRRLLDQGLITRIGPVIRPNSVGVSTLAAMAVPPAQLDEVAAEVSAAPQVNHNYEREHRYNLWFVAATDTARQLDAVLAGISARTGLPVMSLPMLADYHLDLGFPLEWSARAPHLRMPLCGTPPRPAPLDARGNALLAAVQEGLPLVPRPYAAVADRAGVTESELVLQLADWLTEGVLRRFGVVVQHRALGYAANSMTVWDVPDDEVDLWGAAFARFPFVTLCYRRPRHLPDWPYNLFCMIHGRDRAVVEAQIAKLSAHANHRFAHHALFSRRCFKQTGARYRLGEARHG